MSNNITTTHSLKYKIITITSKTKNRECIKADNDNNKLYQKAAKTIYKQVSKFQKNHINVNIKIEEPPKPNNYDRLILFKNNNIHKPCFKQSEATIYLYENGYILGQDYYACDAIQLAKKIKKNRKKSKKKSRLIYLEQPDNIVINNDFEEDNFTVLNTESQRSQSLSIMSNNTRIISPSRRRHTLYTDNEPVCIYRKSPVKQSNLYPTVESPEPVYGFNKPINNYIKPVPSAPSYEESCGIN